VGANPLSISSIDTTAFGPVPADRWGPPADGPHAVLSADRRRCGDPFADSPDPALLGVGAAVALLAVLTQLVAVGR